MFPEVPKPNQPRSSLEKEIDPNLIIEDVSAEANRLFLNHYGKSKYWFFGVWIFLIILSLFYIQTLQRGVLLVIITPMLIIGIEYGRYYNRIEEIFMQQFAAANGFSYSKWGDYNTLFGALFNIGHSKKMYNLVTGAFLNHPLTYFNYNFTIGSGKSSHLYSYSVFQITHDHILPSILLTVDTQSFGGLKPTFPNPNKIKPELNFDNNFDLYVENKFEIEALQIFDPSFLSLMLEKWKDFGIEFNGNKITIFTGRKITNKTNLYNMFELAKYTVKSLDPILNRLQGSVMALKELNPNNK